MADDKHFVPGDFYRIDDFSGFKVRAKRTKKMWNGYIVDKKRFETRHPQDFVRGVTDQQSVPEPRPRPADRYVEIPVLLTASGLTVGYGPPLTQANGQMIKRAGGLGANEVAPIDAANYPKSA